MIVDEASKRLTVSVRELSEDDGFHRVGLERGDGWRRLSVGREVHARTMLARHDQHPAYRSEVTVTADIPVGEWTAVVTGRMDGCLEETTDGWLIEEFKSTVLPGGARSSGAAFERD